MMKLSNVRIPPVAVGTTVRVPIPNVDRARSSPRNVLAVVISVQNDFYKLCTPHGILKHQYAHSEFSLCEEELLNLNDVLAASSAKEIQLREAAAMYSISGKQGYVRCYCKTQCRNNKCRCRVANRLCTSKCHSASL